jgi:hypothetical protein
MKTKINLSIILLTISFTLSIAQIKVTSSGDLHIPAEKDVRFGPGTNGEWIIEQWDSGLNFAKPSGSTNPGNYKFFLRNDNGRIGIGLSNNAPIAKLDVYSSETANYTIGLFSKTATWTPSPTYSNFQIKSVYGLQQSGACIQYGVYGYSYNSTLSSYGRAFGVCGYAGNATSGFNYGVHGRIDGTGNGAAIYGAVPGKSDLIITGQYAGYFRGNVKCEDILWAYDLQESDIRIKKDIQSLSGNLEKISKLNAISYKLKTPSEINKELGLTTTSAMNDTGTFNDNSGILHSKRHLGLSAQEVEAVFPELTYTDANGIMGIHYTGFVPVLIESIKELNNFIKSKDDSLTALSEELVILKDQINSLSKKITDCCGISNKKSTENTISSNNRESSPVLYQNLPNPFDQVTRINLYLPDNVTSAVLYIYDLRGKQIKSFKINERGNIQVIIEGSELDPGMYLYTLITDGQIVDTYQMILSD